MDKLDDIVIIRAIGSRKVIPPLKPDLLDFGSRNYRGNRFRPSYSPEGTAEFDSGWYSAPQEPSEKLDNILIELESNPSSQAMAAVQSDPTVLAYGTSLPIKLVEQPPALDGYGDHVSSDRTSMSWGVKAVGADRTPYTGEGVNVAILDTGIESGNKAFKNILTITKNFSDSTDYDENGHGTHCAGTICGGLVNSTRIGIAPNIDKLIVGKILNSDLSYPSYERVLDAMLWSAREGANIISMSIEVDMLEYIESLERRGVPRRQAMSKGFEAFYSAQSLFDMMYKRLQLECPQPLLVIAAAGNGSARNSSPPYVVNSGLPASSFGVVSVGAVAEASNGYIIAPFSNARPTLVAPGVNIRSSRLGGGLTAKDGTSAATPHVAGVAALWIQKLKKNGLFSSESLRSYLLSSGKDSAYAIRKSDGAEAGEVDRGLGMILAPLD